MWPWTSQSSPWSATAWPARTVWPPTCSTRSAMRRSTCARSPRAPRSATSPWWSTASSPPRRCARCMPPSICRRYTLSIGLIGPGTVGRVLLAQIASQLERLRALNLDLRVRGIASSKRMLLAENSIDLGRWAGAPPGEGRAPGPGEVRGALPGRLHPAYGADRLHRERRGGVALPRLAGAGHPCGDAEQEGELRRASGLPRPEGCGACRRHPLFVRSHRRRRPAGDPDAARSARDRR